MMWREPKLTGPKMRCTECSTSAGTISLKQHSVQSAPMNEKVGNNADAQMLQWHHNHHQCHLQNTCNEVSWIK